MNSKILNSQTELFEIPTDITFLNCANMSPQLRSVTSAGIDAVKGKISPWEITPPDWFSGAEQLRSLVGRLINCNKDGVALIPSASYGIALAAANLDVRIGQNIVLLDEQFPSNVYSWYELARQHRLEIRTVKREAGETWAMAIIKNIDNDTAVVAAPNCHWTDGSLVDLVQVGEAARSAGANFIVDASQSLGAYPLDIKKVRPDFLVSVGYKWLLGPYGLGYLYAAPKWQNQGKPFEGSWLTRAGSENFAGLVDYTDNYRPGARRFDAGEFPQFVLVPMAIEALTQILEWKVERIQSSLAVLTSLIASEASKLGCKVLPANQRVDHMIGIRLPNGIPDGLASHLAKEKIYVSTRGDSIRIAPHLYNTEEDVRRLFTVLNRSI